MRFVLGFDGGGTKTDCVLMDDSRQVRARSRSGPSNPTRVGFGAAFAAIREAARMAMQEGKVSAAEIAALCAGLGGVWESQSEQKMRRLLETEFPGKAIRVCTDLELTLEAVSKQPAIVLIAGTGSAAIGRNSDGQRVRVGGHGRFLGDEGSAFDIGRQATIVALRQLDRCGTNSKLGERMFREMGVADWDEFTLRATNAPDEVFPRMFSVVAGAAEAGDETARALLQNAAKELATLVSDLVERLELKGHKFALAKSGGMVGRSSYFDRQIDEQLHHAVPDAESAELLCTPAEAAAYMALQLLSAHGQQENQSGGS